MSDIALSSVNQNLINKRENEIKANETKESKPAETKKIDKKKLACSVAAAVGIAAVAAYAIHKKGKVDKKTVNEAEKAAESAIQATSEETAKAIEKFEKGIKKFFDKDGNLLEGEFKMQKRKMLMPDGSGFTGTMTTMDKKGNKILAEYKDGFVNEVSRGDKTRKFYNIGMLERSKGFRVEANEEGVSHCRDFFFHDNGKLSKKITYKQNIDNVIEYTNDGKKLAEYSKAAGTRAHIIEGTVFDAEGKIKKKLEQAGDYVEETLFSPDGKKLKTKEGKYFIHNSGDQLGALEISDPRKITYYEGNGKDISKTFVKEHGIGNGFSIGKGDIDADITQPYSMINIPRANKLGETGKAEDVHKTAYISREQATGSNFTTLGSIQLGKNGISNGGYDGSCPFSKDGLKDTIAQLQDGVQIARSEGALFDGHSVLERIEGYIKQLQDFAGKM